MRISDWSSDVCSSDLGGILLTHAGGANGFTPLVVKRTHDVVVRHIRVRTDRNGEERGGNDAFTIEDSSNVILDHVSGSWALDENVNGQGQNDLITVSWRSEERRVGKEWGSTVRSRWAPS